MFAIIKFLVDNTIDYIPTAWLSGRSNAYWPLYGSVGKMRRELTVPDGTLAWELYDVKIYAYADTEQQARRLSRKFEACSDRESDEDKLDSIPSPHKRSRNDSCETSEIAPEPPEKRMKPPSSGDSSTIPESEKEIDNEESTIPIHAQPIPADSSTSDCPPPRESQCSPDHSDEKNASHYNDLPAYQRQMTSTLQQTEANLLAQGIDINTVAGVGRLVLMQQEELANHSAMLKHALSVIAQLQKQIEILCQGTKIKLEPTEPLPCLDNVEDHNQFIERIHNADYRRQMVAHLKRIGGTSVKECVQRMTGAMLKPLFQIHFNRTGVGSDKISFAAGLEPLLKEAIHESMETTDKEIEVRVNSFLKGAKDRCGLRFRASQCRHVVHNDDDD